jgi:hypothetical protein
LQNTAWNVAIIEGILGVIFLVWNLDIKQRWMMHGYRRQCSLLYEM